MNSRTAALLALYCFIASEAQGVTFPANYEVKSQLCDKLNDIDSPEVCISSVFCYYRELCRYECNESGSLMTKHCGYSFACSAEYPRCESLYCAEIRDPPQDQKHLPTRFLYSERLESEPNRNFDA